MFIEYINTYNIHQSLSISLSYVTISLYNYVFSLRMPESAGKTYTLCLHDNHTNILLLLYFHKIYVNKYKDYNNNTTENNIYINIVNNYYILCQEMAHSSWTYEKEVQLFNAILVNTDDENHINWQ